MALKQTKMPTDKASEPAVNPRLNSERIVNGDAEIKHRQLLSDITLSLDADRTVNRNSERIVNRMGPGRDDGPSNSHKKLTSTTQEPSTQELLPVLASPPFQPTVRPNERLTQLAGPLADGSSTELGNSERGSRTRPNSAGMMPLTKPTLDPLHDSPNEVAAAEAERVEFAAAKAVQRARQRLLRRRSLQKGNLALKASPDNSTVDKAAAVAAGRLLAASRVNQLFKEKREVEEEKRQHELEKALEKEREKLERAKRHKVWHFHRGNGGSLLSEIRKKLGHASLPLDDTNNPRFYFKWVEVEEHIDWESFDGSKQMVNYVRGLKNLTKKNLLVQTLKDYASKVGGVDLSWLPMTYLLEDEQDREQLKAVLEASGGAEQVFIIKPAGRNKGNGIELHTGAALRDLLAANQVALDFVVQEYLTNPLLLNGYKFDIRCYFIVATTSPYTILWWPEGYLRLSLVKYSGEDFSNRQVHLTNVAIQRQDPEFEARSEDSIWSFEQLQEYLTQNQIAESDYVKVRLRSQIEKCVETLALAVKSHVTAEMGTFQLMGVDLLICEDLNIHLLEVNRNPDLSVHTTVLRQVIPPVLEEIVKVTMEIHGKQVEEQPLFPLKNLRRAKLMENLE